VKFEALTASAQVPERAQPARQGPGPVRLLEPVQAQLPEPVQAQLPEPERAPEQGQP